MRRILNYSSNKISLPLKQNVRVPPPKKKNWVIKVNIVLSIYIS